ncbi:MAG: glycosyltransferase family 2 protein, partial [Saprospiraceae bacterium]|nr:glycosyltransferase family 2 protein [Saprospiraceae bacterium]
MNHLHSTSVDLVLPCYNPPPQWASNIVESFNKLEELLPQCTLQLIIVDDGSDPVLPEDQINFIREKIPGLRWIKQVPNKGKGAALRRGVMAGTSSYTVFTDIDFPYTLPTTAGLIKELLKENADVVVGQRKAKYYEKTPLMRKLVSKFLRLFNRYILRIPVTDTQCGLKGFNRKGQQAFSETTVNRYLFDLEFLILAGSKKYDLSVRPFIVELREGVNFSKLNLKILFTE